MPVLVALVVMKKKHALKNVSFLSVMILVSGIRKHNVQSYGICITPAFMPVKTCPRSLPTHQSLLTHPTLPPAIQSKTPVPSSVRIKKTGV